MKELSGEQAARRIPAARRKPLSVSTGGLVSARPLVEGATLPLAVEPDVEGVDLLGWAEAHAEFLRSHLLRHGAVLFRNFAARGVEYFGRFVRATSDGGLLPYTYRSTPRTQVGAGIYTATEYPANQSIPLHNENSYQRAWPRKLYFYCQTPAPVGGATPVADSRKVFARIGAGVREKFVERGVMYVRNYGAGLDLSWREVFQTGDRAAVEEFCRRSGIEFEWRGEDGLRTRQVCQAAVAHPETGEMVWFNQAHLFHVSALEPAVREYLLAQFALEDLPRHALYGDGSAIEASALEEIREAYRREAVAFAWREGDVLLVDNMLAAHGREPFSGERRVLVGMAEQFTLEPEA